VEFSAKATLGIRFRSERGEIKATHVLEGGAAQEAGLAAGDAIVAVDGLRPGPGGLDAALARRRPGEAIAIHAFRRDELLVLEVRPKPAAADTCALTETPGARSALLDRWLGSRRAPKT
jgi:predicted metalloprotease with PDZ domain